MRRVRWLAIGAVIGVTGYRRLARAASPVAGQRAVTGARATRRLGRAIMGMPAFLRDVRAGMAEYAQQHPGYIDRRSGRSPNTLIGQRADIAAPPGRGRALRGATSRGGARERGAADRQAGSDNLKDGS